MLAHDTACGCWSSAGGLHEYQPYLQGSEEGSVHQGQDHPSIEMASAEDAAQTLNQTLIYSVNKQSVKEHLLCAMH